MTAVMEKGAEAGLGLFAAPTQAEVLSLAALERAAYQRPLNGGFIKRVVKKFDRRLARRPCVSYRDGRYWLMDGQHITAVLVALGYSEAICEVYYGLTYEEEADLFVKFQTERSNISVIDRFNAQVEAGQESAVAFKRTVERAGFQIDTKRNQKRGDRIAGVAALWGAMEATSARDLYQALALVPDHWKDRKRIIPAHILAGLVRFVAIYRDALDWDDLRERLSRSSPEQLESSENAKRHGPGGTSSGTRARVMVEVLIEFYNKGRRVGRL